LEHYIDDLVMPEHNKKVCSLDQSWAIDSPSCIGQYGCELIIHDRKSMVSFSNTD
jgi:hypothetical protein